MMHDRPLSTPNARPWDGLALVLFAVTGVLVVLTFQDYGVTWDEPAHRWYGELVLDYYLSGFTDLRSWNWQDLFNYGGAFDMTAAAVNLFSPFGTYETRHLLNGITGILGLVGAWKLGRQLGGPRVGLLAALMLALTPNFYGQMFNNPKDVPFAGAMVWSLYYMAAILPELPRPRWSLVLRFGIAAGLAMGVRVGGFLALAYLGLLLTLFGLWRAAAPGAGPLAQRAIGLVGDGVLTLWRVFLPAVAVAYPVMLFFWPWAQPSPIEHPLEALATFSHQIFPHATLFAGQYYPATDLPWAYLPVYILIALPELLLLLLLAAPIAGVVVVARRPRALDRTTVLGLAITGVAIVFPVVYAIAIKAVLFDGMRHFIFVLPPIACLAAIMADRALERIATWRWRRIAYAALGLYAATHIVVVAMLHPDEYVYYNGFVGGVRGAPGLFKLDYWANSYAEAVQGLETYLRDEYGEEFMDHDFTVAVCGPGGSADYYFPSNFIYAPHWETAEFFIAFTKDNCNKSAPGREIYRVERMGTLLSVVLDRREFGLAAAGAAGR
jgi:hypothetical protein